MIRRPPRSTRLPTQYTDNSQSTLPTQSLTTLSSNSTRTVNRTFSSDTSSVSFDTVFGNLMQQISELSKMADSFESQLWAVFKKHTIWQATALTLISGLLHQSEWSGNILFVNVYHLAIGKHLVKNEVTTVKIVHNLPPISTSPNAVHQARKYFQ